MRVAVIGTGIAGLGAAWLLQRRHELVVYEAAARLGGHSHTVDVPWQGGSVAVDSGFIVYNEPNYPDLSRLFATLGVATHESDMSFGVSIDGGRFEYAGSSARALLAQATNLVNPAFQRMLFDVLRFNRDGLRFLEAPRDDVVTLGDFLERGRYGETFRRCYLLPMAAAIWSASLAGMADYPAQSFLRFFANHGLLSVNGQLPWRTVTGGSRRYVEKLTSPFADRIRLATPAVAVRRTGYGVEVIDGSGECEPFDHVVLACHADQALALIERPTPSERSVLGGFRYLANRAVLHRDPTLMPRRKRVWSSGHLLAEPPPGDRSRVPPAADPQPAARAGPGERHRRIQLRAPAIRRGDARGPAAPRRDPGPRPAVVLRRALGLRLPRGRAALGLRGRDRARDRTPLVAAAGAGAAGRGGADHAAARRRQGGMRGRR